MSDESHSANDVLARLIQSAGRRESPPAAARERALAAATQAWRAQVVHRRRRQFVALAAGVAALGVATVWGVRLLDSPASLGAPIARVERVIGAVHVRSPDADRWHSLQESNAGLLAGAVLRTDSGSAAAVRIDQSSVRLASGAEVVLESSSRLRLIRGKVYIDTGGAGGAGRMHVATELGSASDVGTQFEVQYTSDAWRVRVREGAVLLQQGEQRRRAGAGEQVSIDAQGAVSVSSIASTDPQWRWVQALAAAPDIDNQPLTLLLAWVARETGASVRYATADVERRAARTILHGSIRHLAPLEALAVMLATTDLQYEVVDGVILIK